MPEDDLELEACWKAVRPRLKGGRSCRAMLVGKVFGRLRVVAAAGTDKHGATLWRCICECGQEKVVQRGALKGGRVKSCGCLLEEYKRAPKAHLNQPAATLRSEETALLDEAGLWVDP